MPLEQTPRRTGTTPLRGRPLDENGTIEFEQGPHVPYSEKATLLTTLLSKTCPGCGGPKRSRHWLCLACRERVVDTPEGQRCWTRCDAHVRAAQAMIARARKESA